MKMNATIKVEFEMIPDQPENAANAALERGLGELRGHPRQRRGVRRQTKFHICGNRQEEDYSLVIASTEIRVTGPAKGG